MSFMSLEPIVKEQPTGESDMTLFRAGSLLKIIVLTVLLVISSSAFADSSETSIPTDSDSASFWVLDVRSNWSFCDQSIDRLDLSMKWYEDGCGPGHLTSSKQFIDSIDPNVPLVIYVHGNQVQRYEAKQAGRRLFQILKRSNPDSPFRLVVWSWPSAKTRNGIRRDADIKSRRSDLYAYYMAQWIDRLPKNIRLSLVGHSFGARMIAGTMQLLAGGDFYGRTLSTLGRETPEKPTRQYRLALIAAAIDSCWLAPPSVNGRVDNWTQRVLVTVNRKDRALRWYPLMSQRNRSGALGYIGPPSRTLSAMRNTLQVINLSNSVGATHNWNRYLCSCRLQQMLSEYVFLKEKTSQTED
jgi:Alpha/beta hydrolase of unknown function (DUF900)